MGEVLAAVEQFMTAEQAEETQFDTVRKHGYNTATVDAFVSRAAASLWKAQSEREALRQENATLSHTAAQLQDELATARSAFHEMVDSLQESLRRLEELSDMACGEATDLHDRLTDAAQAQPTADAAVEVVALAHTTARATLDAAREKADALVEQARSEALERRQEADAEMALRIERLRALAQTERDLRATLDEVLESVRSRMSQEVLPGDSVIAELRRHLESADL